jgi:hypothetical protein
MEGSCENGNESSVSATGGKTPDQLTNYQLLINDRDL